MSSSSRSPRNPIRRRRSASSTGAPAASLAPLATFRELTGKRFATSLAERRRAARPGGCWPSAIGDPATLDREAVVRVARLGRAPPRRPRRPLAGDLADAAGRRRRARWRRRRWRRARGARRRRGLVRPEVDLSHRRRHRTRPARCAATGATSPRRRSSTSSSWSLPGGDAAAAQAGAERGVIIGEGANLARNLVEPRRQRRQPGRARRGGAGRSPSSTACRSTSSSPSGRPSSAWACSWPSAGAATTRRG